MATTGSPPKPTGMTLGVRTSSRVSLSWDEINGTGSHQVRYRRGGGSWGKATETTDTAYTETGHITSDGEATRPV